MVAAQRRWGWGVSVALAAGVAGVDLLGGRCGVPLVGWLNLGLVWLFAHQLGVAWRDGAVSRLVAAAVVARWPAWAWAGCSC